VGQDEEDIEQRGSCQGEHFLDRFQTGRKRASWQGMPQMKGMKELKLPVGQQGGGPVYREISVHVKRPVRLFIPSRLLIPSSLLNPKGELCQ
jgi:hypothetical protein